MATESATGLSDHVRGVTVTTLASLAGVLAGLLSGVVVGTTPAAASDQLSLAIVLAFIFAQYPLLKVVGVDVEDFGTKDHLFVSFMTFTLWFVTYTVLLSTNVTF